MTGNNQPADIMKEEILLNIENPAQLEKLYRKDKPLFRQAFQSLYPDVRGNMLVDFWNERLNYVHDHVSRGRGKDLVLVIIASLIAGCISKIPTFFSIDEDLFFSRNLGFIVFPLLSAYFAWKNKLSIGKIVFIAASFLAGLIFINALPIDRKSDSIILSGIHLTLLLWATLGFAFAGGGKTNVERRLDYLRYNGELAVLIPLMLIAGGILSGVTVTLFTLIGLKIEDFYLGYVVVFGLSAAPFVGTYLTQNNPQLVGRILPVIARIFSPLVLIMLVTYLVAMIFSGKDPYNNREFLIFFNGLLVGVMAIIFFSIVEISRSTKNRGEIWVLFLLSVVTLIVNGIALSAILFRISEWGFSPNRTAVLGSNLLVLINLVLVGIQLSKSLFRKASIDGVGKVIALFLPVYWGWTIVVTFIFPVVFHYR